MLVTEVLGRLSVESTNRTTVLRCQPWHSGPDGIACDKGRPVNFSGQAGGLLATCCSPQHADLEFLTDLQKHRKG